MGKEEDKFARGKWVRIPLNYPPKSEILKFFSESKYNVYKKMCAGKLVRIIEYDPGARMVKVPASTGMVLWLKTEWLVPIDDDEVEKLREQDERIREGNKQLQYVNERRDRVMKGAFKKASPKEEPEEIPEIEQKKPPQPARRKVYVPPTFGPYDDDWFDD